MKCGYGKYCMCQTCEYQLSKKEGCYKCADCVGEKKQIHDVWTCTKYERKKHLR